MKFVIINGRRLKDRGIEDGRRFLQDTEGLAMVAHGIAKLEMQKGRERAKDGFSNSKVSVRILKATDSVVKDSELFHFFVFILVLLGGLHDAGHGGAHLVVGWLKRCQCCYHGIDVGTGFGHGRDIIKGTSLKRSG